MSKLETYIHDEFSYKIATIDQDINGKWYAFISANNEYSPAFEKKKSLIKWLKREGYKVDEE